MEGVHLKFNAYLDRPLYIDYDDDDDGCEELELFLDGVKLNEKNEVVLLGYYCDITKEFRVKEEQHKQIFSFLHQLYKGKKYSYICNSTFLNLEDICQVTYSVSPSYGVTFTAVQLPENSRKKFTKKAVNLDLALYFDSHEGNNKLNLNIPLFSFARDQFEDVSHDVIFFQPPLELIKLINQEQHKDKVFYLDFFEQDVEDLFIKLFQSNPKLYKIEANNTFFHIKECGRPISKNEYNIYVYKTLISQLKETHIEVERKIIHIIDSYVCHSDEKTEEEEFLAMLRESFPKIDSQPIIDYSDESTRDEIMDRMNFDEMTDGNYGSYDDYLGENDDYMTWLGH